LAALRGRRELASWQSSKPAGWRFALTSSPITEEVAEQFGGFLGQDSLILLNLMVELGVVED
jgi:hypothetical protein